MNKICVKINPVSTKYLVAIKLPVLVGENDPAKTPVEIRVAIQGKKIIVVSIDYLESRGETTYKLTARNVLITYGAFTANLYSMSCTVDNDRWVDDVEKTLTQIGVSSRNKIISHWIQNKELIQHRVKNSLEVS